MTQQDRPAMAEQHLGVLLVGTDPFFVDPAAGLVARAAQVRIPRSSW